MVTKLQSFLLKRCFQVSNPSAGVKVIQRCVKTMAVRAGILVSRYFVRYFDGHFDCLFLVCCISQLLCPGDVSKCLHSTFRWWDAQKNYQSICNPLFVENYYCWQSDDTNGDQDFVELCLPLEGLRFSHGLACWLFLMDSNLRYARVTIGSKCQYCQKHQWTPLCRLLLMDSTHFPLNTCDPDLIKSPLDTSEESLRQFLLGCLCTWCMVHGTWYMVHGGHYHLKGLKASSSWSHLSSSFAVPSWSSSL